MSDTPGPAVPLDIPANFPGTVTALLQSWTHGDPGALARVLPLVYDELRAIARSYMRHERPGHTLGVTGLVHEAFLRLSAQAPEAWRDRKHFYGIAARLMRQVLVDYSRHHSARKRDSEMPGAEPPQAASLPKALEADYVELDQHLTRLEHVNQRRAEIVELRFFGGLSIAEIAEAKDLSPSMVKKELTMAKVWLHQQIQGGSGEFRQPEG
ncbi:MAG: sigma-70 family RNA polymerase sigma factor [Bryobacterales bacterium]|nr:sigma-70 family RNA polymerase sigma factor [Bryobacterales bacterium]